ncbi:MAG TPA: molybdate ABC transporter permease subunit [Verrucomicrobiae bacterium]|nr:molybdate ABC transporter permease subunit [Verrucomicrobiae bacterium]
MADTWQIVWFSVLMSACATVAITPAAIVLAWLLARKEWIGKSLVETAVSLPLVMPPAAVGLILLKLFGRRGEIGSILEEKLGLEIVFTWRAVLLALAVMSFPLMVRAVRLAFEQVPVRFEQVARTLGARSWRVFFEITLPLGWRGVIAGMVLGFARSLGEFGATIVVAGAIPGKTATLSVSIFNLIQLGRDAEALRLLVISVLLSFGALWCSEMIFRRARA